MGNTGSSQKISSQDRTLYDLPQTHRQANHLHFGHRAILDLKNQRDKIKQYQVRITVLTDRETEIARQCLARNDRRRALLALRRKKYQETLLDKTNSQLLQLEQLTSQVEFALVQKDVMYGLQQGTQVLQTINREMGGIEGVERLMGENEEARAYQEVSRMLEGNLSNQDEDEVEDELEALRLEVAPKVPQQPVLPDAPVQQPVTSVPEREEVVEETRTALPA
ncbi:uncharacterized protein N7443_009681 [Penicillium atrosanguineum]|uniref:uncharacterized protein n=1 Tax=Penicillium atrosanguineum TaxID=1132637 RepID=UPI0023A76982|nr:uncharacterized protein N7443_009681 [Penicillium atrosanguineum]KAJ5289428.1 hypothetical protein N7443_009681 [Penicillium atrosanguineum]